MRHLIWCEADPDSADRLVLCENDGTVVVDYGSAERSWHRIERGGRWFRLNGRDRETGELIYLPEVELV